MMNRERLKEALGMVIYMQSTASAIAGYFSELEGEIAQLRYSLDRALGDDGGEDDV